MAETVTSINHKWWLNELTSLISRYEGEDSLLDRVNSYASKVNLAIAFLWDAFEFIVLNRADIGNKIICVAKESALSIIEGARQEKVCSQTNGDSGSRIYGGIYNKDQALYEMNLVTYYSDYIVGDCFNNEAINDAITIMEIIERTKQIRIDKYVLKRDMFNYILAGKYLDAVKKFSSFVPDIDPLKHIRLYSDIEILLIACRHLSGDRNYHSIIQRGIDKYYKRSLDWAEKTNNSMGISPRERFNWSYLYHLINNGKVTAYDIYSSIQEFANLR